MDYGAGPRTTPLIYSDKVYVLSAFGELRCLDLRTGATMWQKDFLQGLRRQTRAHLGLLRLAAGGRGQVDRQPRRQGGPGGVGSGHGRGAVARRGRPANYSSLIAGDLRRRRPGGRLRRQVAGRLGTGTGRRLWTLEVEASGGYIVPTPLDLSGNLLIADQDNQTQLFAFDAGGVIRNRRRWRRTRT